MARTRSLSVGMVGGFLAIAVLPVLLLAGAIFLRVQEAERERVLRHLATVAEDRAATVRLLLDLREEGDPIPFARAEQLAASDIPSMGETAFTRLIESPPGEPLESSPASGGITAPDGHEKLFAWARAGPWRVLAEVDAHAAARSLLLLLGPIFAAGALLLGVVVVGIYFVGRRADRAFGEIVESIGRASRGEFGHAGKTPAPAGLRNVHNAIREMHESLGERDGEITRQRQELFCQRCELERLNSEIVEADRMKGEFVANMSHEVRTPLHSILALSQVLLDETSGPLTDEQQKQVGIIERGGRSLLHMLGDILDFSKIEAGRMIVQPESVSPAGVLAGVRESVAPIAAEKGLALELDCERAPRQIRTDPERLHRILLNLAHNAIKFTERGTVSLRAIEGERDGVIFEVHDTGPGIERDKLQIIFEPFRQADGSTTRAAGGTGLGLSIVKSLVGLLGGRVAVESEPGEGTVFSVVLPAAIAARASGGPRSMGALNHVLVVGATPPCGEAVRSELLAAGFGAGRAVCGRDVRSALDRTGVGAILLDVGLFQQEGMAVFGSLAERIRDEGVPLIGYWVDPVQRTGGYLGELRVENGTGGDLRLAGAEIPPLDLPGDLSDECRRKGAEWFEALSTHGFEPFHEVMRRLFAQLDSTLGRNRDPESARHVLICDPDEDARYSLALQLERLGYRVESVERIDALQEDCNPDLVVTEISLPDAENAVAALRRRFDAPLVVLTADARPEAATRALEAGAVLVEVKPAEPHAFLSRLAARDLVVEQA